MVTVITYLARVKKSVIKICLRVYDLVMNSDKATRYQHFSSGLHNPNFKFLKSQIALVNVPKTGCTTLYKLLLDNDNQHFVNLHTHRPVSVHCPPQEYRYVTVLRNPVDRVWSQFQMVMRSPDGYPYKKFAKKGLKNFMDKCWVVRNMECRYLSGEVKKEPDDETLHRAMLNLDDFYAVLDFSNFSEEVALFCDKINIKIEGIPNERKSIYEPPTPQDQELIKQYNQLDIALYKTWQKKEIAKKISQSKS